LPSHAGGMATHVAAPTVGGMGDRPDARVYEIRVQGELAPRWSCWFAGLAVESDSGEPVIVGPVDDQAALHGLLARIRDLGLPLLAVRVLDDPEGRAR
jgi:hypothetical protein